jgi:hypothetical protein
MTKVVVGEKVRKEIIETGKLGGYPVTGGVVKGIKSPLLVASIYCRNTLIAI